MLAESLAGPAGSPRVRVASDKVALSGIWQLGWPPETGLGVQQHAVEVDVVAERGLRDATRVNNPGPSALQPMSAEAIAGVPRDVQLTVRAADAEAPAI